MPLRTVFVSMLLLAAGSTLAATPPTGPLDPPELPATRPVGDQQIVFDRAAGFSRAFRYSTAGTEVQRAFVYPDGVIALEDRLAVGFADTTGPLSDRRRPASPILLALHLPLGGTCPGWAEDEAARFNRIEYAVESDDLIVVWRAMLPAEPDCASKLEAQASTFSARLSWGETFEVSYTYHWLAPGPVPRVGVMLPQGAFELLPDQDDKPRTDRAFALAAEGSEGDPGDDVRGRTWIRGLWVMGFDDEGRLVGDLDRDGSRSVDNCPVHANIRQEDLDGDGDGDICDTDLDGDDAWNLSDNCVSIPNRDQQDSDGDGWGDACDHDDDADGIVDMFDHCPLHPDPTNADLDADGRGDPCDRDIDGDDTYAPPWADYIFGDLCPHTWDPDRLDSDGDRIGDACDLAPRRNCNVVGACDAQIDSDGDGIADADDTCPTAANPGQTDTDGDGIGNLCDADCNGDGTLDVYQSAVRSACIDFVVRDIDAAHLPHSFIE